MICALALGMAALLAGAGARAEVSWPAEFTDPAALADGGSAADLLLEMPCGAAMAFQKVTVPMQAGDPLADRRLLLGQSLQRTGYSDYLRSAFLRGPFVGEGGDATHYYIARYELTAGQWRAMQGDCAPPTRADRIAHGGLSWFEAVDFARAYSEWLLTNAADRLPRAGPAPGFLRLPTEDEWEYAARGGASIDATAFPALTYFGDGDMRDHALHQAPGSARGRLGPVGLKRPNPLGLFDVYGNAEELALEPYRMNAAGRAHGQAGGMVTRGGSVFSTADQIYSAQRTEYAPFDAATGAATRSGSFGLRLVIAAPVFTSDEGLDAIRRRWSDLTAEAEAGTGDPDAILSGLIAAETDPLRQTDLNALQLEFRRARERIRSARMQSARATLLSGAVFVETLIDNAARIEAKAANLRMLVDLQRAGGNAALIGGQMQGHVAQLRQMRQMQSVYLLSYRAALDVLASEITAEDRRTAYGVLEEELSLSGRSATTRMLDRFWADLQTYAGAPDMDPEALLRMALD
jgi:hypothetical protein